jgi:hypothetical protein
MLEARVSGAAHMTITPGFTFEDMDCQCRFRYDGVKKRGNRYSVEFVKLD